MVVKDLRDQHYDINKNRETDVFLKLHQCQRLGLHNPGDKNGGSGTG